MLQKKIEIILDFFADKGHTTNNIQFLKEVSSFVAELLNINYVLIDKYSINSPDIVNSEAFYNKEKNEFLLENSYNLKGTPCENVINKNICIYPDNIQSLFPKDELLGSLNIKSYIGVPLWNSLKEPIGVISIMDLQPMVEIENLEIYLKIISIKVEKVLESILYEEKLKLNIENLNFSNEIALNSEEKFKKLSNLTFEGILIHDNCTALDVNLSFAKMFGYTREELIGKDLSTLLFSKKHHKIIENNLNKNYALPYEIEGIKRDGSLFYVEIESRSIEIDNKKAKVSAFRNITEKKKIEKALSESENRYKILIEQAGDAMYLSDFNGNILDVNNKSVESTGYSRSELIRMKVGDIDVFIPNLDKQQEVWRKLYSEKSITLQTLHKRKDGSIFNVEVRIGLINIENQELVLGFARDITERVKTKEENQKLSIAVEQSANSIIITDLNGNIEYTNPKFTELSGYTAEEVLGKSPTILNSGYEPEGFHENIWNLIKQGNSWHGQFKNRSKSGQIFWEQVTITPIKNSAGEIINYLTIKVDISNRKKAEKQLINAYETIKEKEDYLNKILHTANEGFWIIDRKAITVEVNAKMCSILNYEESEIKGKSIYDFVDAENRRIFNEQLKKRAKGISTSYEIDLIKGNGKKVTCLFKTSPIKNNDDITIGSFALVTDISKLKNSYKILENKNKELKNLSKELSEKNKLNIESNKRFKNLFDQSPISLLEEDYTEAKKLLIKKKSEVGDLKTYLDENPDFVIDCISKIEIISVNQNTLELFMVENEDELLAQLRKTLNNEAMEVLKNELLAVISEKNDFKTVAEFIRADGEKITTILKLAQIDVNGKVIVSLTDITALKNVERELIVAKEKAEGSNRLKTEFLNNMSHEIRTPMNGILGFSELLNSEELSAAKRKYYISIIQNSGHQLLHVIDDILEISRLGTKQVKIIEKSVCLNDLLLELFSVFDLKAKENKIPLYIKNGLSDEESTILTDNSKLKKIVSNLLENALKFTNKGHISFGYLLKNNNIEIFVKDTGVGIKSEKQEIIFERFSQEEREVSQNIGGLGLGLSIAKENTELLGGIISVESKKWEGSTFKVSIPYKPVNEISKVEEFRDKEIEKKSKLNILVAEDEEVNYLFIEILLTERLNLNCNILHAKDGKEAVDICKNNPNIDFVLMDINMPIMNGFEATKQIREILPTLPIIAQTAYSTPEDKEKALEAGCNDFISKPINNLELKTIIDYQLNFNLIKNCLL